MYIKIILIANNKWIFSSSIQPTKIQTFRIHYFLIKMEITETMIFNFLNTWTIWAISSKINSILWHQIIFIFNRIFQMDFRMDNLLNKIHIFTEAWIVTSVINIKIFKVFNLQQWIKIFKWITPIYYLIKTINIFKTLRNLKEKLKMILIMECFRNRISF